MYSSQPQPPPSSSSSSTARPTSSYLEDSDFGFQPRPSAGPPPPSFHTSSGSSHLPSSYHQPPSYDIPPPGPPPPLPQSDIGLASNSYPQRQSYGYEAGRRETMDDVHSVSGSALSSSSLGPEDSASAVGDRGYPSAAAAGGGMSFIDERGEYYSGGRGGGGGNIGYDDEEEEDGGLVRGAAPYGGRESQQGDGGESGVGNGRKKREQMDYSDSPPVFLQDRSTPTKPNLTIWGKIQRSLAVGSGKFPKEQRIENKKRGLGRQARPWASWTLSVAMICAMIFELVKNKQLTGSVIAIKPSFNWMIGPSSATLVNVGARFVPCMKNVVDAPLTTAVACFNETRSTDIPLSETCTVADWCGLKVTDQPRQRYRFIVPVFLHAGIIHLALNLLVLNTAGAQVEKEMGSFFFLLIFFSGAIFGFELGGNFALPGVPSVGASGGIFAVNAVVLVDLLEHWQFEERPKLKLGLLILELLMMIGLGYIPLLIDNFAHIGGLLIGLLLGVILYPCISTTKRHRTIVWIFRGVAFVGLVLALVFVSINFFAEDASDACEWCRYLSCVPVKVTNYCKGTGLPTETTTSSRRSSGFEL
ncbi:rhomboid family-domain-containing protein [Mrakia frigida]|uniref:rhomboid family-domain-containing protein n=1 Tax=Mrakia frigida TaxID=29902 RepID=UPI003FCBF17B